MAYDRSFHRAKDAQFQPRRLNATRMQTELNGKVAVVTGGAAGFGIEGESRVVKDGAQRAVLSLQYGARRAIDPWFGDAKRLIRSEDGKHAAVGRAIPDSYLRDSSRLIRKCWPPTTSPINCSRFQVPVTLARLPMSHCSSRRINRHSLHGCSSRWTAGKLCTAISMPPLKVEPRGFLCA